MKKIEDQMKKKKIKDEMIEGKKKTTDTTEDEKKNEKKNGNNKTKPRNYILIKWLLFFIIFPFNKLYAFRRNNFIISMHTFVSTVKLTEIA